MNIPIVTDIFAIIMKFIMTQITSNFGLAIIIFAFVTKILLFPLQLKSKKGMIDQQRIAPKVAALEKKYGSNKQKYSEELQKLYKEEGVSMLGGCLPTVLVLVVVLGLYGVVYRPMTYLMGQNTENIKVIAEKLVTLREEGNYVDVDGNGDVWIDTLNKQLETNKVNELNVAQALRGNLDAFHAEYPGMFEIRFGFLGLDLGQQPSYSPINTLAILPVISMLTAFGMSWVTQKLSNPAGAVQTEAAAKAASSTKSMMYVMPIMSLVIGFALPAGLTVYWIINNIASAVQEPLLNIAAKKRYGGAPAAQSVSAAKKPAVETTGEEKKED